VHVWNALQLVVISSHIRWFTFFHCTIIFYCSRKRFLQWKKSQNFTASSISASHACFHDRREMQAAVKLNALFIKFRITLNCISVNTHEISHRLEISLPLEFTSPSCKRRLTYAYVLLHNRLFWTYNSFIVQIGFLSNCNYLTNYSKLNYAEINQVSLANLTFLFRELTNKRFR